MKRMYRRLCWLLVLALMIGTLLCGCSAEKGPFKILLDGVEADSIRYTPGTVNYQVSVIERDGKFGLIDFKGNIVLPIEYRDIWLRRPTYDSRERMLFAYTNDGSWTGVFLEADGTVSEIEDPGGWGEEHSYLVYWNDGIPVVWGDTLGLGGSTFEAYKKMWYPMGNGLGTISIAPATVVPIQKMQGLTTNEYDEIVVNVPSEEYALLDFTTGELLTDFIYEECSRVGFVDGVLPVKKDGKWGYVNDNGEEITEFIYDASGIGGESIWTYTKMYASTNGYTVVRQGDKWGLIDNKGNTVVEPIYDDISQVTNKGLFWIKRDGKWAVAKLRK